MLWFMSHGHQHSLWSQHLCQSQGTLCQGTASREAALRGYRWAQVGAHGGMHTQGRHRTAHTRAHAGTCRHGHMDPVHTSVRSKMCTKVPMWAHLPGLTPCLHVQPARSDLGKHPGVHVPAQQGGDTGGCYSRQCQGVTRRAQPDTHPWGYQGAGTRRAGGTPWLCWGQRWGLRGSEGIWGVCPSALSTRGTLVLEAALRSALLALERALSEQQQQRGACGLCAPCLFPPCANITGHCPRESQPPLPCPRETLPEQSPGSSAKHSPGVLSQHHLTPRGPYQNLRPCLETLPKYLFGCLQKHHLIP